MFTVDRETGTARIARTPEGKSYLVQETGIALDHFTSELTLMALNPAMRRELPEHVLYFYRIDGSYIVISDCGNISFGYVYQTETEAMRAWEYGSDRVWSSLPVDKRDDLTIY